MWQGLFLKSTFINYLWNSLQNLNFYCPKRFQQTCPFKEGTTLISDICTEFGYLWFFSFPCCKFLNGLKDGSIDFQSQQLLSKRCCIVGNKTDLFYSGLYLAMFLHFFPKSFQNLSQNCKFFSVYFFLSLRFQSSQMLVVISWHLLI